MNRGLLRIATGVACLMLVACGAAKSDSPHDYPKSLDSEARFPVPLPRPSIPLPTPGSPVPSPRPQSPDPGPILRPPPIIGSNDGSPDSPSDAQLEPIDKALLNHIQQTLQECADKAYSEVINKHLKGQRPSDAECDQKVPTRTGETMTLAMWLGAQMHDSATLCVEEKLSRLKPGGFNTNPRYIRVPKDSNSRNLDRNNPEQWRTEWVSPKAEAALSSKEKLASIVPDVVIHSRHPLRIQAVFDFKFPCKSNSLVGWRVYPPGHPYQHRPQGHVYREFLKAEPRLIRPQRGQ